MVNHSLAEVLIKSEDTLGLVIRAHVHIEKRLDDLINEVVLYPKDLPKLWFESKVKLLCSLGFDEKFQKTYLKFNKLRNDCAHKLKFEVTDSIIKDFFNNLNVDEKNLITESYEKVRLKNDKPMPSFTKLNVRDKLILISIAIEGRLVGELTQLKRFQYKDKLGILLNQASKVRI